ncbi:hypothetical protein OPL79_002677, partial [Enterococcus faecalis]|nr:hypothetical protein [Enterococcus faecalis]
MSSLKFIKNDCDLVCRFHPQESGLNYVASNIKQYDEAYIKRVFKITKEDITPIYDEIDTTDLNEDILELILNDNIESIEFV